MPKFTLIKQFIFAAALFCAAAGGFCSQTAGLVIAQAEDTAGEVVTLKPPIGGENGEGATLQDIIANVTGFIFWLGITICPIFIVWGGFLIATAGGESAKIEKGKQIITYSIVGVVIIAVSSALASVVTGILGG